MMRSCFIKLSSLLYVLVKKYKQFTLDINSESKPYRDIGEYRSNSNKDPYEMSNLSIAVDGNKPGILAIERHSGYFYLDKLNTEFQFYTCKLKGIPLYLHPVEKRVCYKSEIEELLKEEIAYMAPLEELYDETLELCGLIFMLPSDKLKAMAEGHLPIKFSNKNAKIKVNVEKISYCDGCELLMSLLGIQTKSK